MARDSEYKKDQPSRPGKRIDVRIGEETEPLFARWLRAFKQRYKLDQPDYRDFRGSRTEGAGRVDPVAAYRFQRLTARDRIRFTQHTRELAKLGYDLRTYEGIDKFWRLSQAERDRLYYVCQDPEQFKDQVRRDFFDGFKAHFGDFQARFAEFFQDFQETEPSFDPDDLAAHYRCLGLSPDAPVEIVKDRYRALAYQYHPDHGGDEARMKALNIAYASVMRAAKGS